MPAEFSSDATRQTWTVRDFGNRLLTRDVWVSGVNGWDRAPTDYVWRGDKLLGSEALPQGGGESELAGPAAVHYALDHLGTIRLITNASGNEVSRHTYYPFGREATPLASTDPMQFTGHERDFQNSGSPADDLDYMHARFSNPTTGRFHSVDPIGGNPGTPQSWNRYCYVGNNPMSRTDPDGRAWNLAVGALIGGGVEYATQVTLNVVQGDTGFIHAFHENIDGKKILVSGGIGALTSGLSAIKTLHSASKVLIAVGGNLAEAKAHAEIDGVALDNATAATSILTGGAGELLGQAGQELAQGIGTKTFGELKDTARRTSNIAADGRPRPAQSARAADAAARVAAYGGGAIAEVSEEASRKAVDRSLEEVRKH